MLAEIAVSSDKPTLLFYAHLDKQPYMDGDKFEKWEGVAPTELRWNADKSRAYGRGAADEPQKIASLVKKMTNVLATLIQEIDQL